MITTFSMAKFILHVMMDLNSNKAVFLNNLFRVDCK